MAERMLIVKLVLEKDNRVALYGKGHKFKDLTLFDASDLADVGIAYADLQIGQEMPCRFWAIWEESDKLNQAGHPYKDVVALESIGKPATTTSVDNSAVLAVLRAILIELRRNNALLSQAFNVPPDETGYDDIPPADEDLVSDAEPSEDESPKPATGPLGGPLNEDQARRQFNRLAGPSIREGKIESTQVNEFVKAASVRGWADSLRRLRAAIEQEVAA